MRHPWPDELPGGDGRSYVRRTRPRIGVCSDGEMSVRRLRRPAGRDCLVAAGCLLLGVLLYLVGMHTLFGADADVPLHWRLAALAVACVGQLWRSTVPLAALLAAVVAVAVDAVNGPTLPVLVVLADVLFTATLYASRRVSRFLVGASGAVAILVTVASTVIERDWRLAFVMPLQVGLVLLVPVWWARNVRQHRDLAEVQRERAAQVAKIAELDRRAAVAEERSRMARDLHDVIAGQLSAIALQSEALLSGAGGGDTQMVLRSVRENSVAALAEMRTMIDVLRGDSTDARTAPPRLAELDALVTSARTSGLRLELEVGEYPALPAPVDLAAYRILQEALTNVTKHAPGAATTVRLHGEEMLVVEVVNELTGEPGEVGTGLVSMRERAEAVGGTLHTEGGGGTWLVRAELPIGGRA